MPKTLSASSSSRFSTAQKPELAQARLEAVKDMGKKLIAALYHVDVTIEKWNNQLMRAQPLRSGRLQVSFMKNGDVLLRGHRIYEVEPVLGKLIYLKNGSWSFFQLNARDGYKNLSDLRVGKGLPSDPLVVRLIDGIEDLLARRSTLIEILALFRKGVPGKLASVEAACVRREKELLVLSKRVRLDWNADPVGAELAIKKKNHERYLARKAKAIAAASISATA